MGGATGRATRETAPEASGKLGSLPAELSSLVGRGAEAGEVKRLLGRSRLVTLTGPGGVGKTRLALHAARSARGAFRDGAHVVSLAGLSQPDLLVAEVAARLSAVRSSTTRTEELALQLGEAQLLLVLDNCEHLTDAVAGLVTSLLEACSYLKVLASSREALRVDGEAVYSVPPLALPAAVELFCERASAVRPDPAGQQMDERAVGELCRRVDGLPLAIELAAARTRWQSVDSMLARWVDPLDAGYGASRSLPPRHQSLRASLDHSHDLCSAAAQVLWRRLSVFRGGATLEAAETVCAAPTLEPVLLPAEVAPALFELVDKSVVVLDGSRYSMLETVRQYGAERLDAAGEAVALGRAHLDHVASLAERVSAGWFGPRQSELLAEVLDEQANVRAALALSLASHTTVRIGLRTASALWTFWISSGLPGEGRSWLDRLLAASPEPSADRARALWTQAFLLAVDDEVPAARELLTECRRLAAEFDDPVSAAQSLTVLGVAELFDGRLEAAVEHLEAGIGLERTLPDAEPYLADALINVGLAHCYRRDTTRARAALEEARRACEARDDQLLLSWAEVILGLVALLDGDPGEAASLALAGLARKRELRNSQGVLWATSVLAWAALDSGDPEQAAVLLGAGEVRAADFGPPFHGSAGMREWCEEYAERTRAQLGSAGYRQSVARGTQLSLDELVSTALGERPPPVTGDVSPLGRLGLTRREREVAELVGTGRTNREIAELLVIAPRTVDTHVQHILTKLDFTSRSQVVALVARGPAASGTR